MESLAQAPADLSKDVSIDGSRIVIEVHSSKIQRECPIQFRKARRGVNTETSEPSFMPLEPWTIQKSQYLVKDQWMTLRADRVETAKGVVLDPFYVTESANWVQIVALDHQNRVLLTRQYRHGHGRVFTEIPCGMMDPGEAPETAALRELAEETGAEVEHIYPLPSMASNAARDTNVVYPFVATGTKIVKQQTLDPSEEIEFFFAEIPEVFRMLERGEFIAAVQLSSIFMALKTLKLLDFQE